MGTSTVERVQKYRQTLRASGLRPVQIWLPDTRQPGFSEECRRQSMSILGDAQEKDTLDWLAAVADRDAWV